VRLWRLHPAVFALSCADCKKWLYKAGGELTRRPSGPLGLPVLRPPGTPLPCHQCPKIAAGDEPRPENAQELTDRNRRALAHYLECAAVGCFPDDPLVRRHAALIKEALAAADEARDARDLGLLGSLLRAKPAR
jgi:hypothetical protein